ncbi:MAG: dihydrofolate reductase [Spirochaetales bacterium]|jgi:dihydrofolate reductase|nr:dihydrofolate reductase [Spirochaetales bacterium]
MISIIVAVASNNAIGKNNELLWHIPDDLKRFKKLTLGHCLIMGKKTWFSLPRRPLPGRNNIVMTDDPCECIGGGCITAYSVEDALSKCEEGKEVFVIGGGSVYRQFLDLADRLYLTHVHRDFDADTFFPDIDPGVWQVVDREDNLRADDREFSWSYVTYDRKKQ